ncbi:proto-oncogene Mas-like [Ambystoma mexicanum]|uniref:proto-oncogene Mas-like n=1 Tax=Ambystoma mexicanum TaxID=8296 RepID=UPI0037E7E14F
MSQPPPTVTEQAWAPWQNHTYLDRPIQIIAFNTMCLLVCIFGLAGNGIVTFFLGFRIKRSKFTVYVLNLAVADFMFLLCMSCLFMIVIVFIMQPKQQHVDMEQVIAFISYVVLACIFGYNTSLYLLTAISVERCLSVLYPVWYQCRRPRHLSAVVCGLLWVLSCLVTSTELLICNKDKFVSEDQAVSMKNTQRCTVAFVSVNLLSFIVFTPLMVLSSVTLLIKVKRDSWKQQPSRLYVVIVATVVLFLIFALPMRVMLQADYKLHGHLPMVLIDVSSLFSSINSSVNPFIYWFVGRWGAGKGSLQTILQRIFREDVKRDNRQHVEETADNNRAETVL